MLDLEYAQDEQVAHAAITKLVQYAREGCGIKLDGQNAELVESLTCNQPKRVEAVILTPSDPDLLGRQVQALHNQMKKVVISAAKKV